MSSVGVTLRPLRPGETREVELENGELVSYIKPDNGPRFRIIPSDDDGCPADDEWPCIVHHLDHGGIGAAGSEFMENCQDEDINILQWTDWDKFHQCTRDCKNAIHKHENAEEIQCTSSYAWTMNYKPFGSGEWQRHKAELLHNWLRCHTRDSPQFIRWCDKLAKSFEAREYDGSPDSRQSIYDNLCQMSSFLHKGCLGE